MLVFHYSANFDRSVRTTMQAIILLSGRAKHVLDLWKGLLKRNTCGFTEEMGTS